MEGWASYGIYKDGRLAPAGGVGERRPNIIDAVSRAVCLAKCALPALCCRCLPALTLTPTLAFRAYNNSAIHVPFPWLQHSDEDPSNVTCLLFQQRPAQAGKAGADAGQAGGEGPRAALRAYCMLLSRPVDCTAVHERRVLFYDTGASARDAAPDAAVTAAAVAGFVAGLDARRLQRFAEGAGLGALGGR